MTTKFPKKVASGLMDMSAMDNILDDLLYQITYSSISPEDLALYSRKMLNAYIAQRLGSDGVEYIANKMSEK
jgi:hypothetical protein